CVLANDRAAAYICEHDTGRATVTEAANPHRLATINNARIADAHAIRLHLCALNGASAAPIDRTAMAIASVIDINDCRTCRSADGWSDNRRCGAGRSCSREDGGNTKSGGYGERLERNSRHL